MVELATNVEPPVVNTRVESGGIGMDCALSIMARSQRRLAWPSGLGMSLADGPTAESFVGRSRKIDGRYGAHR